MKKNYEDLQKQIDNCNTKITKVSGNVETLKASFNNQDLERINEIKYLLDDKLNECDKDTNGEKERGERSSRIEERSDKPRSLVGRKKVIIGNINKMVNQFNENNKQIKESNKVPKSEREMSELIKRNKEIQDDCKSIDEMITSGRTFAVDINDRLDALLEPTIQDLKDKYVDKNQAIDECDELFDRANASIDRLDGVCDQ